MSEFRYVIHRTGSGAIGLVDTLKTNYVFIGLGNIEAMGLKRSDLEELKEQIDRALEQPQGGNMGKVNIVVESGTYNTYELERVVKKWFDLVSGVDEDGVSYTGDGYTHEYNNCRVYVVPSGEE